MLAIDLDEIDSLSSSLRLLSFNRRNLYSFHDADYLPIDEPAHNGNGVKCRPGRPLRERVVTFLESNGCDLQGGRILLVTLPRVVGYLFNPVSFYFCHRPDGEVAAVIAEVTNTFREMKPYFIGPEGRTGSSLHRRTPKHFYVSPFSDVDVAFDFTVGLPDGRLQVRIDDLTDGKRTLTSTLTGISRPLTDMRLAWYGVKYPFITLRVIALIHWHALRLWIKRVPWFAKAARNSDQRDLYRPHGAPPVQAAVPVSLSPSLPEPERVHSL